MSHSAENLCRETFTVPLISSTEKVWIRGGGVSRYSVEIFLSHSAENLRRDYFIVALISGTEKFWRRGGREYQEFTSKNFCLTVPKISVGNTLLLLYFRVPKKFEQEGGGVSGFPVKSFLSHKVENFRRGTLHC